MSFGFIEVNNELLFSANYNANGNELWKFGGIVGVHHSDQDIELKLYPNPAIDFINLDSDKPTSLTLMNIHGQILTSSKSAFSHQLDLKTLSQGIYVIKINESNQIHRFVKE